MKTGATESVDSDLYAIPILDQWLLTSPRTGTTALVNHSAVTTLAQGAQGCHIGSVDLQQLWRKLSTPVQAPSDDPGKLVIMPKGVQHAVCVL